MPTEFNIQGGSSGVILFFAEKANIPQASASFDFSGAASEATRKLTVVMNRQIRRIRRTIYFILVIESNSNSNKP